MVFTLDAFFSYLITFLVIIIILSIILIPFFWLGHFISRLLIKKKIYDDLQLKGGERIDEIKEKEKIYDRINQESGERERGYGREHGGGFRERNRGGFGRGDGERREDDKSFSESIRDRERELQSEADAIKRELERRNRIQNPYSAKSSGVKSDSKRNWARFE